ncbi:MAG: hypothetical protein BGO52_13765 [Sphingobacteriales bacterium 44-61]|nr:MAG: hypothetical protein BGO52_13765 [Sphingobacteriales bacterium 44-61]
MKNIHKIFSDWNITQIIILEKFGVKVEEGYDSFILEEGEVYNSLKPYLDKWHVRNDTISQFSDQDLNNADRLVLRDVWANSYPMPDGDGGYKKLTYEDTDYCTECGVGLLQKEPFRLKKEPNWGNKKIFSLNWIYDELFVERSFYETLLKGYEIEAKPVLLYKKDTIIDSVLQLVIPITSASLQLDSYAFEVCKSCGRKRYALINHGFFPPFEEHSDESRHLFKSNEYFGTGANARRYIFISSELRKQLEKFKVKANYIPCS